MNNLEILYEDNHIIVVVKPNNVLSQGDATGDKDMLTIVKEYIKVKYNKPGNVYVGLVHRLDRPVGGIMVFAKTSKAASRLSEQVRKGLFNKKYLAIVHGINLKANDEFIDYLMKTEDGNSIIADEKKGKYCRLTYNLMAVNKESNLSLVEVNLDTGRHHQIRVQFASRGFPLYGDQRYGKNDRIQLSLYAYELSFYHPITKKILTFRKTPNLINNVWQNI